MKQATDGMNIPPCPIDALQGDLLRLLQTPAPVLVTAPPGTGKSSRIPLWLLNADWVRGRRILMLEPRRIAARSLARYMAGLLGETPGRRIGWRMRGDTLTGPECRIEIVTEGVLTRMIQSSPDLENVACIIFDEFHERSLQTDLGLALTLDARSALRPDLRVIVMSATMDAEGLARLLDGSRILSCEGRAFPTELRWLPPPAGARGCGPELLRHMAGVISALLSEKRGSILAFLPGTGEIRRLQQLLEERLPPDVALHPLFADLSPREQDAAIAPTAEGSRKVVLSTAIAETSLTIEGVSIVVDSGYSRLTRFDAQSGMDMLVTERVSLAGAAQRTGRAGRTGPGLCCRLWDKAEENGMLARQSPEITRSDLSGLALQLAAWGVSDEHTLRQLPWIDLPPAAMMTTARQLLMKLGATDANGRVTPIGNRMAQAPLSPRPARLLIAGNDSGHGALACVLAAVLDDAASSPARSGGGSDITRSVHALCTAQDAHSYGRSRKLARRLAKTVGIRGDLFASADADIAACGMLLAAAWPDLIAMRSDRQGREDTVYNLRSGRAACLTTEDPLSTSPFLVAVALTSRPAEICRIRLAAPLDQNDLTRIFGDDITVEDILEVSDDAVVQCRRNRCLGSLVLRSASVTRPSPESCRQTLCRFLAQGDGKSKLERWLPWSAPSRQLRARMDLLHELEGEPWPDVSNDALLQGIDLWLGPYLTSRTALRDLNEKTLLEALKGMMSWQLLRRLDEEAPQLWQAPSGAVHPIVYGDDGGPWLAAKLQEFFGCEDTPRIARGRMPLTLHLNSPAGRPLQITRDLAHFWRNGYAQVRSEMLGRYPKHPWPKDPLTALPTKLTKKRLERAGSPAE